MPESTIRVLLIEDDQDDYVLTRELLAEVPGRRFQLDWEQTYEGGLEALGRGEHDVCLVDFNLGAHSGLDVLQAARESGRCAPLIMLTGSSHGHQADAASIQAGADDFLVKGSIDATLLDRSIRYAIHRRRLERRLVEAQKLESLGVLAGGIAHDFNNLLFVISGNAELALASLPAGSSARESIEEIAAASTRAAELARAMLAYSGMARLVVEPVDLPPLVNEVGQLVVNAAGAPIELRRAFADGLPAIVADVTQIRQVVTNLFTNAVEALGAGGGSIKVRAGLANGLPRDGFRFADQLLEGPYVRLEVEDDGPGMDGETLDRLFDPFFTTKFTGRGLGLAAVLGIIRSHNGAIRVTSEPGGGTVFDLLLRAHVAPAS